MKKWSIGALALLAVMAGFLLGSSRGEMPAQTEEGEAALDIVCSTFPEYDWVRNIVGETGQANITLLTDNGVDLHSYQPSAANIIQITDSDLFLYIGGTSDLWAEKLVKENRQGKKSISLLKELGEAVKAEELVEGMQAEEEEHHDHAHDGASVEYDEHIWLSLKNAEWLCRRIADALSELDEANADAYRENCAAYLEKLSELDQAYQNTVDSGARNTILFGDRFPFRYLTDDYGLSYYAAFAGCSAETEASFETIVFLSQKLKEEQLPVVFVLENSNQSLAKTVASTAGNVSGKKPEILVLDSMQSMTRDRIEQGASYLSIMESNLEALEKALN